MNNQHRVLIIVSRFIEKQGIIGHTEFFGIK